MAQIPRPNLKAMRASVALPKPSFKLPHVSAAVASVLLPLLTLVAMVIGYVAAQFSSPLALGAAAGAGLVIAATAVIVAVMLVRSANDAVIPLFMTRYGINERERAQELLSTMTEDSSVPSLRVIEGALRDDLNIEGRFHTDAYYARRRDLFKTVGVGPARLYLDRESAALVERDGKFIVLHAGVHELTHLDRVKGYAHLRTQKEVSDLKGMMTRDMIPLDVKVSVTFQLKQDMRQLEQTQMHTVAEDVLRRALLPSDTWRTRTKAQITLQIKNVIGECELWQLFVSPPKPPVTEAMSAIFALGQSALPSSTRIELETRLKTRLNDLCWRWGVEITRVSFDELKPPQDLIDLAHRTYQTWNQIMEQDLETDNEVARKKRLAEAELAQARMQKEAQLLNAEAEKQREILHAEGEAEAYEMRMKARADGALEFARRIETLRQAMGNTLDEGSFRELLRALDLLREDEREDYDRSSLSRLLMRPRMRGEYPSERE